MSENIIEKLKEANLLGRGGAAFPTWKKWDLVRNQKAKKIYIVCNGAEGEPGVSKDHYILEHWPEEVIAGIKIALETFPNSLAYLYLRKDYYQEFKDKLEKIISDLPIQLFKKTGGYLAGEETTLCSVIEGGKVEPRLRPPFPGEKGIQGFPTLINNLETFYHIAQIARDKYKKTRFYSISGEVKNPGVYELPEDYSIKKVLQETKNYPDSEFFIQSGGGMAGEILLSTELDRQVSGQGAIVVYDKNKTNLLELMQKWVDFFYKENCDKCVPCREGVYRIREMLGKKQIDRQILQDLFLVMQETSFCALGKAAAVPFKSLIEKVYPVKSDEFGAKQFNRVNPAK